MGKAPRDSPVLGPTDWTECYSFRWQIEGRPLMVAADVSASDGSPNAIKQDGEEDEDMLYEFVPTRDEGEPGDFYKVRLRVAGKYRTVDWERLNHEECVGLDTVPAH